LEWHEDAPELVVLEIFDARDDLRVADGEAKPPAGHPVRLGHREELEADLSCTLDREERRGLSSVEDEIAVCEVV
jgi:hypothetical protein